MAVTLGKSALKPTQAGVFAVLNVAALTTGLGYDVGVFDQKPNGAPFPYVRIDTGREVPNSTFGQNGKDVEIFVQIFDDYPGDLRIVEICDVVMALLNPAGSYRSITVAGFNVITVKWDGTEAPDDQDLAGVSVGQKTMRFTVMVLQS